MSHVFPLVLTILLPLILGFGVLNLLPIRLPWLVVMSVSYGLGLGVLSQGMLLLDILGIGFRPQAIILFQLVLIVLCFIAGMRKYKGGKSRLLADGDSLWGGSFFSEEYTGKEKLVHALILSISIYYVLFIFNRAVELPIYGWDSFSTSLHNAKLFYYDGSLKNLPHVPYPVYPLLMPFLFIWSSCNFGFWEDQLTKIFFPLYFVTFVLIYSHCLYKLINRKWALYGIFLLLSSNLLLFHAVMEYRDIILLYYTCSAVLFMIMWRKSREGGWLILSSLFVGFGTFTKVEGNPYLVVQLLLFMYILFHEKSLPGLAKTKLFLQYAFPCTAILLLHYVYKMSRGISTMAYASLNFRNPQETILPVMKIFGESLFLSANWNLTWLLLCVSLVVHRRKVLKDVNLQVLLGGLVMFISIFLMFAIFSSVLSVHVNSHNTASRLILQIFPLATLLIVFLNAEP